MTNLTRTELRAVAKVATVALRAELGLHDPDDDGTKNYFGEYVTGAQVRAVVEALEEGGYEVRRRETVLSAATVSALKTEYRQAFGRTPTCDDSDNEKGLLPHLTPDEVAAMPDPAPFPAPAPAPEIAEPDHEFGNPLGATWTPKQHALYLRLAPALQRMAREGYMPTKPEYNAQRGDLPTYDYLLTLLGCKWSDLAAKLGLQVQSRHRGPGKDKPPAKTESESVPAPDLPAVPRLRGTAIVGANGLVESIAPAPILQRAPDGGVTRILPRADNSQAHSLPSAFAGRNSDGRQVRPAYRTED